MIGTLRPCSRRAAITGVLVARIRSGGVRASSAALRRKRSPSLTQRYSICRLRPSQPPQLSQSAFESGDTRLRFRVIGGHRHQRDDPPPAAALLRPRGERPSGYTAAEKCDEFPPPHGLTPRPRIADQV